MSNATTTKERPIIFSTDIRWIKVASSRLDIPVEDYVAALNNGMKPCGGCNRTLPRDLEHFGREKRTFDGLRSQCRECVSKSKKRHYHENRDQQRARQRIYQRENREKLYEYNAKWQRERNKKVRAEMITAYGSACACCGEAEPLFLELDHKHNNGAEHRRKLGNQFQVILWLKENNWPTDDYQLLCSNCNQGKERNGGICPHKTK